MSLRRSKVLRLFYGVTAQRIAVIAALILASISLAVEESSSHAARQRKDPVPGAVQPTTPTIVQGPRPSVNLNRMAGASRQMDVEIASRSKVD